MSIVDLMASEYTYPIMQGISTTIVLVRADLEIGLAYDVDNKSLPKIAVHFAASQRSNDIQLGNDIQLEATTTIV